MSEFLNRCIKEAHRGMLWKVLKVGKWVVIADLSIGVLINAAWAFGCWMATCASICKAKRFLSV